MGSNRTEPAEASFDQRRARVALALALASSVAVLAWATTRFDWSVVGRESRGAAELSPGAEWLHAPPRWEFVDDLPRPLLRLESVFWEADDTASLREWIRQPNRVGGLTVLEIGAGTGLISLCCARAGAARVVATDINPAAVASTRYNAEQFGWSDRIEARLVPRSASGAYSVLRPGERFDLIVSNPPWEDGVPESIDQFAFHDPGFALLESILDGLDARLKPGGRLLLAYGSVAAVRRVERLASERGWRVTRHDDRPLDDLPEVFLPGMLLEVVRPQG